jgi:NADH-quinone oxidoreductase subunit H
MLKDLFYILIFPGFMFLSSLGFFVEYFDRKLHALLQNRIGPPWFQPLADFLKLIGKAHVIPEDADPTMFTMMPVFALAANVVTLLYIPLWSTDALFSFSGDVIVILYLLTIPTLTFFLGGWYSASLYSMIGAIRSITQLFAYEVPLFIGVLSPAIIAGTWSVSGITKFYSAHPAYCLLNILAFAISLVALLSKLEKVPFDTPEAETEIVAGSFTEYSGALLAIFRMAINTETIVGAALLAAVFLPFGLHLGAFAGFVFFLVKVFFVVALMTVARTVFARLRIDQMMNFYWWFMAPVAFVQLVISFVLKGVLK